jgi:hypothetical protein
MAIEIPYSIATNAKEFLTGLVAEQASYYNSKEKAAKDINTFVSEIDTKLRLAYDKYIPNVHVIDAESFTNILANRLAEAGKNVLDPGADTGIAARFADKNSTEYKNLSKIVVDSLSKYHNKLLSNQTVKNPIDALNSLSSKLFARTRKIDNPISARILGLEFSKNINSIFGNRAVLAAVDPRLGSSSTRFVFFSSSFNAIGTPIKENVYKPVEAFIKATLGTDTVSGFGLGTLVNAGHASLINDLGSFVNSPAFAQVLYGVSSGRSSRSSSPQQAAEIFKIESKLLENSIRVDKTFLSSQGGYGVLLALGVTFTNIEDAELNQQRGRISEASAVRSFNIQKPTTITKSAKDKIVNTILRLVLRNNPALGKSSRSIVDFLTEAYSGILLGKRVAGEKSSTTVRTSKTVKNSVQNKSEKTSFNKPTAKSNKVSLAVSTELQANLTGLQNLINQQLQDVISANMGDGSSRSVLNYRSGRLASSAKVESMSQSRAGLITAFYTYMKNPYATFSSGGKQSSPASRDPKLLISKSIREIAAQQVGNRLRAVNI